MVERHTVSPENAQAFKEWIATRGGVAVWRSINLSNPGASWSTPAMTTDGKPTPKPTWQAANEPERIVTREEDIDVIVAEEVKRFHVAVRQGSGLQLKCTDASSKRIWKEVEKAGEGAFYLFDYLCQEAVIMAPMRTVPLNEWDERDAREYERGMKK